MRVAFIILAILGAGLIACGAALWFPPVGLIVGGTECIVGAYVGAYLTKSLGLSSKA